MSDKIKKPYRRILDRNPLYALSERDLEKIDGLISLLGLAIYEIIVSRAVKQDAIAITPMENRLNKECYKTIDPKK